MKNIYRLVLFSLLKTDQGKQLKQKETNCFSIHLIIELWLKELPFWSYQKISTKTSVDCGEEIDSFRDGKMLRDTCLCLVKAKKSHANCELMIFLNYTEIRNVYFFSFTCDLMPKFLSYKILHIIGYHSLQF